MRGLIGNYTTSCKRNLDWFRRRPLTLDKDVQGRRRPDTYRRVREDTPPSERTRTYRRVREDVLPSERTRLSTVTRVFQVSLGVIKAILLRFQMPLVIILILLVDFRMHVYLYSLLFKSLTKTDFR